MILYFVKTWNMKVENHFFGGLGVGKESTFPFLANYIIYAFPPQICTAGGGGGGVLISDGGVPLEMKTPSPYLTFTLQKV